MLNIRVIKKEDDFQKIERIEFVKFLHKHLGKFGDPIPHIQKCLDYSFSDEKSEGGFALAAYEGNNLVGGVIINKTGMGGYIPENILVYIAVDASLRGKGIGSQLINKVFDLADGDIKLHVEHNNPAKHLYERLGFAHKYAEMRFENN